MTRYTVAAPGCPVEDFEADYALAAALAYGLTHHLPDRSVVEVQREGWTAPRRVEIRLIYTARWMLTAEEREADRVMAEGQPQTDLFGGAG